MQRKLLIKVEGQDVDGSPAMVLVYELGEQVSLLATTQIDGDAEVLLDKARAATLAEALSRALAKPQGG